MFSVASPCSTTIPNRGDHQGLHTGTYVDPKAGEITVDELASTWLTGKAGTVKRKYYMDLQTAYRLHVQPAWGVTAD